VPLAAIKAVKETARVARFFKGLKNIKFPFFIYFKKLSMSLKKGQKKGKFKYKSTNFRIVTLKQQEILGVMCVSLI